VETLEGDTGSDEKVIDSIAFFFNIEISLSL
jgi:hypothetical protein